MPTFDFVTKLDGFGSGLVMSLDVKDELAPIVFLWRVGVAGAVTLHGSESLIPRRRWLTLMEDDL